MEQQIEKQQSRLLFLFAGIFLGILLIFAVWIIINLVNKSKITSVTQTPKLALTIQSPANFLATSEKTVTVSGTTGIKSVVTINSPSQNKIFASQSGTFTSNVDMVEGKNIIKITVFDPVTGTSESQSREVLYLNEDLTGL